MVLRYIFSSKSWIRTCQNCFDAMACSSSSAGIVTLFFGAGCRNCWRPPCCIVTTKLGQAISQNTVIDFAFLFSLTCYICITFVRLFYAVDPACSYSIKIIRHLRRTQSVMGFHNWILLRQYSYEYLQKFCSKTLPLP